MPIPFVLVFGRLFKNLRWLYNNEETRELLFLVFLYLMVGTLFYNVVEEMRVLDALYFSVVTLTTVGYGDFTPGTDIGKIFTIGYIFVGLGLITAFISAIAELTLEEQARRRNHRQQNSTAEE